MKLITVGADSTAVLAKFNPMWIVGGVVALFGGTVAYCKLTEKSQMRKIREKVFEAEALRRKLGR